MAWTKDGVRISGGRRKRVYALSGRSSTLRISTARDGDSGRYRSVSDFTVQFTFATFHVRW